jgi:hypothetical protein
MRTYAVALHETGHILGQCQDSQDKQVCEKFAWKWAYDNALVWNAEADHICAQSMVSYWSNEAEEKVS